MMNGNREILIQHSEMASIGLEDVYIPINEGGVVVGKVDGEVQFMAHINGSLYDFFLELGSLGEILDMFLAGENISLIAIKAALTNNTFFYFMLADKSLLMCSRFYLKLVITRRVSARTNDYSKIYRLRFHKVCQLSGQDILDKIPYWSYEMDNKYIGDSTFFSDGEVTINVRNLSKSITLLFLKHLQERQGVFKYTDRQKLYITKAITLKGDCVLRLIELNEANGRAKFETKEGKQI